MPTIIIAGKFGEPNILQRGNSYLLLLVIFNLIIVLCGIIDLMRYCGSTWLKIKQKKNIGAIFNFGAPHLLNWHIAMVTINSHPDV